MANPTPKPSRQGSAVLTAAILFGALMVAAIGTVLPGLIGITGAPAIWIPLVFYAVAAVDVVIAFWLRARIRAARQASSGTVERQ